MATKMIRGTTSKDYLELCMGSLEWRRESTNIGAPLGDSRVAQSPLRIPNYLQLLKDFFRHRHVSPPKKVGYKVCMTPLLVFITETNVL